MYIFIIFFDYIIKCTNLTEIYNDIENDKIHENYAKFKCDKLNIINFYDIKKIITKRIIENDIEFEIYSYSFKKYIQVKLSKNNILDLKKLEEETNMSFYVFKTFNSAVFSKNKYINQRLVYFSHSGFIKGIEYIHNKESTLFLCENINNLKSLIHTPHNIEVDSDKIYFEALKEKNKCCYIYTDFKKNRKYNFYMDCEMDCEMIILNRLSGYKKLLFFSNDIKNIILSFYSHKNFDFLNEGLKKCTILYKKNDQKEEIKIQYKKEQELDNDSYIINSIPLHYLELFRYYNIAHNIYNRKIITIRKKIKESYKYLGYDSVHNYELIND